MCGKEFQASKRAALNMHIVAAHSKNKMSTQQD